MSEKLINDQLKDVTGAAQGPYKTYIVRYGDTLASISKYLQVSQSVLINWNNIKNPDLIKVGDKLIYPA